MGGVRLAAERVPGNVSQQMGGDCPMTELTELVKLLTALVGLLAALAKATSEAPKQKARRKRKGHRR